MTVKHRVRMANSLTTIGQRRLQCIDGQPQPAMALITMEDDLVDEILRALKITSDFCVHYVPISIFLPTASRHR